MSIAINDIKLLQTELDINDLKVLIMKDLKTTKKEVHTDIDEFSKIIKPKLEQLECLKQITKHLDELYNDPNITKNMKSDIKYDYSVINKQEKLIQNLLSKLM